jgi:hypothetical protein
MFLASLRQWVSGRSHRSARGIRGTALGRSPCRPLVEPLEDRTLPSTYNWIASPATGQSPTLSWTDPHNWILTVGTPNPNGYPSAPGDQAVFGGIGNPVTAPAETVTIPANTTINVGTIFFEDGPTSYTIEGAMPTTGSTGAQGNIVIGGGSVLPSIEYANTNPLTAAVNDTVKAPLTLMSDMDVSNFGSANGATGIALPTLTVTGPFTALVTPAPTLGLFGSAPIFLLGSGQVGTLADVSSAATISPSPSSNGGVLQATSITLTSTTTFNVALASVNGQDVNSELAASGTVTLGGAKLTVTPDPAFLGTIGKPLTIVSGTSVTGTFTDATGAPLADGATVSAGGLNFTLHYTPTSVTLTAQNSRTATAVTVTANPSTATVGQPVTFTATVTANGSPVTSGTVQFLSGTTVLATAPVTNGTASSGPVTTLPAGSNTVTASFSGAGSLAASTSLPVTVTVSPTFTLTASPTFSTLGTLVTFTATVGAAGTGGTVAFAQETFDGTQTSLGPPAPVTNGTATLPTSTLTLGQSIVIATFTGTGTNPLTATARLTYHVFSTDANTNFVNQLYLTFLGRNADSSGLALFVGQLAAGMSRATVVKEITASTEFFTDIVRNEYQRVLQRAPDSGGMQTALTFLQNGGTVEQLDCNLATSPEFFNVEGGGTIQGFVNALYRAKLGRSPDAGSQTFLNELQGGASLQTVCQQIITSTEFQSDEVNGLYIRVLQRSADSAGFSDMLAALRSAGTESVVAVNLAASDEFFQSSQAGGYFTNPVLLPSGANTGIGAEYGFDSAPGSAIGTPSST